MIRTAVGLESAVEVAFPRDFESWWTRRRRGTRYAEMVRDLPLVLGPRLGAVAIRAV